MFILYHDDVGLAVDADPGDVLAAQLSADPRSDASEDVNTLDTTRTGLKFISVPSYKVNNKTSN